MSRRIATFFYGSFMDRHVLRRLDIAVDDSQAAMLPGFQIELRPRVNLRRSDRHVVFGAVMKLTHSELARLYGLDATELQAKGVVVPAGNATSLYEPEPVLVTHSDGSCRPAICYIAESQTPAAPSEEYVRSVVAAALTLGLPRWYVDHLASFSPGA